MYIYSIGFL